MPALTVLTDNSVCSSCISAVVEDMGCGEIEAGFLCMEMGEDLVDHTCNATDSDDIKCACMGHFNS